MNGRRVVITGIGCISPLGVTAEETWQGALSGVHGFRVLEEFQHFPAAVYALAATHDPQELMPGVHPRHVRKLTLPMMLFFASVKEAYTQARLADSRSRRPIGIIAGTTSNYPVEIAQEDLLGYYRYAENDEMNWEKYLSAKSYPQDHMWQHITNFLTGFPALHFGFSGYNRTIHTSCACGTHAVGEAYRLIKFGYADTILAGAAEAFVNFAGVSALGILGVLSKQRDCRFACRPFDANRDGIVLGEGAATLVLESLDSALERGAPILAELAGFGMSTNAFRVTDSPADGRTPSRAISHCLEEAGVLPEQIGAISAHATSTRQNDVAETNALKLALGEYATQIPTFALKSALGHSLSASGATELTMCVQALQSGMLPPIASYRTPDPDCNLAIVREPTRVKDLHYLLKNSFGFGGQNGSLLLKKWAPDQAIGEKRDG